jgi:hypothetical protein
LQNGGGISAGNYFSTDKFMDRVHVSVDRPGMLGAPWTDVIPRFEIGGTKPLYVCPGCFIHTYGNNMINRFHVQ